jgi:UDP-glucose 4-epimerase
MQIQNKNIFITGGAGYLGKNLIKRLYDENDITIYSRDEAKHYFLKKQYPNIRCIVGDVRNYELLKRSTKNHDIGIFAASLKQIEACDENYEEANQIIVQGAFNSKNSAIENNFDSACFISTDKSRAASTIYGSLKHTAGESFISNNNFHNCKFTTAIYGNILNSTGSIIPVIWEFIKNKKELLLFGSEMTRFMLTVEQAIDLIFKSFDYRNVNTIPAAASFKLIHLFEIYEEFGLKYKLSNPRPN